MSWLTDSPIIVYLLRTLQIICVLGSIILIHEFGHFIVAKRCGMVVDEFAVGIGPTLKRWERGGTLYRVGLFLFMGYVRIRGLEGGDPAPRREEAPGDAAEAHPGGGAAQAEAVTEDAGEPGQPAPVAVADSLGGPVEPRLTEVAEAAPAPDLAEDPGSFYARPIPYRVAALLAGAGMNVAFAAFLFCVLYGVWGVPVPPDTRIDEITPQSPADLAGLEPGWKIAEVDGEATPAPSDVQAAVADSDGRPLQLTMERDGERRTVTVTPRAKLPEEGTGWVIGVKFGDDSLSDIVARTDPGRPAAAAGIRAGDRIVAVNGRPVKDPAGIPAVLAAVPKTLETRPPEQVRLPTVQLGIERQGERLDVTVQPEPRRRQRLRSADNPGPGSLEDYLVGDAGLALQIRFQRLGWGAAVKYGFADSWSILRDVFDSLVTLLHGRQLDQVGGPVMIVKALSEQAFYGWYSLLSWAGMLSIMIGVFNLLPLPALDGGRVVFVLAEPLSGQILSRFGVVDSMRKLRHIEGFIHAFGLFALLALMVLVSFRDVGRW